MDLPVALFFFPDNFSFISTLQFCQDLEIDATDLNLFACDSLALFDFTFFEFVRNYVYFSFGITSYILVIHN